MIVGGIILLIVILLIIFLKVNSFLYSMDEVYSMEDRLREVKVEKTLRLRNKNKKYFQL